ncbi:tRNA lysidine(34) synthetase TilS [Ochrobactrum sp. RH2CCR150]|uniref:tRNA lysidine(34) synthetase TilS n=1 Tax=Ochrobactrum sp. RH2CCR150 TaxID=2587044 RepID=UPI0015F88564|nr:tRNA(Ile)-lysidine synthase [Ochrobactrum sp. RH2CCR150]
MGLSPTDIFKPFQLDQAKAVIAAVSGGSDSLAMLFLLKDHLATLDPRPALLAVTIDHRLRAESADEAENVGALCREHGIAHRILAWDDPKPSQGLAAAARSARYRLLVQAAHEADAAVIVTGHTQDDQIETFLMRKERSHHAEARGLAAMAPQSWLEGSVQLIRPLLSVSRQALRDELTAKGLRWVDDPSNANTDYERPRVRQGAAADADPQIVLAQVALASAARKRDNAALVAALADPVSLQVDDCDRMEIDPAIYAALPETVRRLFSGLVASLAGGRRFLPGDAERLRIERILSGDAEQESQKHESRKHERLTIFGALIERGAKGLPHRFRRERRNLPSMPLPAGGSCIWDGRFRFFNSGERDFEIAAPGRQALIDFLADSPTSFPENASETNARWRETLLVLPAIYADGKIVSLPFLPGENLPAHIRMERHFALFDHVLPGYDFALAEAIEKRIGRQSSPNS